MYVHLVNTQEWLKIFQLVDFFAKRFFNYALKYKHFQP